MPLLIPRRFKHSAYPFIDISGKYTIADGKPYLMTGIIKVADSYDENRDRAIPREEGTLRLGVFPRDPRKVFDQPARDGN